MVRIIVLTITAMMIFFHSLCFAEEKFTERKDVKTFITMMVKKHNFNKQQLMDLFSHVKLRPQVIQSVKKPLEAAPWSTYQLLFVNEWRIQHGVIFWNKYSEELKRAEKIYGVPASVIVATIGIETKYGTKTGEYRVIDSLTSLAFSESPRANFFRHELEEYLLLTKEQKLDPLKIMGSYAGAIGQPQFMPSSYRNFSVNFSNSGQTDLMHDTVDVIGSIANYYKKHGWITDQPITTPVLLSGFRYRYFLTKIRPNQIFTLKEFARHGITPKELNPDNATGAKLVDLPIKDNNHEYWLGFRNFDVIKRYNPSDLYAMAVYQLGNYISKIRDRLNNGQPNEKTDKKN